jgi:hypothetical protein
MPVPEPPGPKMGDRAKEWGPGQAPWDKSAPPAQDYTAIADKQIQANRPNQSTPYGSSSWKQNPDGTWSQDVQFGGPLAGAFQNVGNQFASATSSPLDFGSVPALQYGEDARKAAVDSAYTQATSRLDPQWQAREDAARTRLINQGLDPSSEAFRTEMGALGRERNDAYGGAMSMAIGRGAEDAGQMFNQSATARQMEIANILRKRAQPLAELGAMQGFLQQPSFNPATGMVEAARAEDQYVMEGKKYEDERWSDLFGGITGGLGGFLKLLGIG